MDQNTKLVIKMVILCFDNGSANIGQRAFLWDTFTFLYLQSVLVRKFASVKLMYLVSTTILPRVGDGVISNLTLLPYCSDNNLKL